MCCVYSTLSFLNGSVKAKGLIDNLLRKNKTVEETYQVSDANE
jgi:hypothetical protein